MRSILRQKITTTANLLLGGHVREFLSVALNKLIKLTRYRLDVLDIDSYQYNRFKARIPLGCSRATTDEVKYLFAHWPDSQEEYNRHYEVYFTWGFQNCFIYRRLDTGEIVGFCFLLLRNDSRKMEQFLPKKILQYIYSEQCAGHEWLYTFEKYRQLGISLEGIDRIVKYCQLNGIRKLYSHRGVANTASIRFADRIGFVPIGVIYHLQLFRQKKNQGIYWTVRKRC